MTNTALPLQKKTPSKRHRSHTKQKRCISVIDCKARKYRDIYVTFDWPYKM